MLALLVLALVSFVLANQIDPYVKPYMNKNQVLARFAKPHPLHPYTFSWDSCGGSGAKINNLAVIPDPIVLGDNMSLSFSATINTPITSSSIASLGLTLEKKVLGIWVEIPCVDNIGSCTYTDPCTLLNSHSDKICPGAQKLGLPCKCPISASTFGANNIAIKINDPHISWLTNGDFYAKAELFDGSGNTFLCLEVYASISSNLVD